VYSRAIQARSIQGSELCVEGQGAPVAVLRFFRAQPDGTRATVHVRPLEGVDFAPAPARPEREPGHVAEYFGRERADDFLERVLLREALADVVLREPPDVQGGKTQGRQERLHSLPDELGLAVDRGGFGSGRDPHLDVLADRRGGEVDHTPPAEGLEDPWGWRKRAGLRG